MAELAEPETNLGKQADPSLGADVETLVQWFESAEDASIDARKQSERDRDYYDNKQLTAAEKESLRKRGQPATIINRIKRKIDYLLGIEKKQPPAPKALPRNPGKNKQNAQPGQAQIVDDEDTAYSATDAIRYVTDEQTFKRKRSKAWKDLLIQGAAGFDVGVEQKEYGPCVTIARVAWDRMFWDPHSSEDDFSDAMYLGVVVWMDRDEAEVKYKDNPDVKSILESTMASARLSETFDDKPKFQVWADRQRQRVRIVQMYFRPEGEWYFAEFTKGGLLKGGISPYLDKDKKPDCGFLFQSCYVDRDNNRYGVVREMISPQDEYNKRRSKLLHHLTTRQVRYDRTRGATTDIEKVRKELAKPDGVIEAGVDGLEILRNNDQVEGQFRLLQITDQDMNLIGANSALLGEQAGAPSGKAIQLNQTGGLIELGDVLDALRALDGRVYNAVWNRVRQFWTAEKWIRVTDDARNDRFVGFNIPIKDPMTGVVVGYENPIGELDVDITIEDAPDGISPQQEQFQGLVELAKAGIPIPALAIMHAAPNLRNRDKIIGMMEEQGQKPDPEVAKAQAQLQIAQQKAQTDAQIAAGKAQQDAALAQERAAAEMMLKRSTAETDAEIERFKAQSQIMLEREKAAAQIEIEQMKAEASVKINAENAAAQTTLAAKKPQQSEARA